MYFIKISMIGCCSVLHVETLFQHCVLTVKLLLFLANCPIHSLITVLEVKPKYPCSAKICYAQETAASAAAATEAKLF